MHRLLFIDIRGFDFFDFYALFCLSFSGVDNPSFSLSLSLSLSVCVCVGVDGVNDFNSMAIVIKL